MEPPSFPPSGLHTVRAAPGSDATLVLPAPTGTQPFNYQWSRAGASLDERFTATDDAGGVRLTVSNARTGDTNVYTLQASNAAGSDTNQVHLEVCADEAPTGEDPPTFLRRLQDLTVKVGTRTRFLVEIVSSTECKVTWFRNERRLLEAERVALARDGNFWCADVAAVSVDDAGRWTCTAENAGGRASCSAHLNVLVPKAYKRPEFVEELRALLTEQGTVSLECKVVGVPTPVLRWFKDSCEIKAGDVFALTANAEDPTSLGTYTCEAVNCMGRAYSSSKVHVVGRGSREGSARPSSSSVALEPPPIFTKELEEQFVKICEPLILGCHIVVPPWPRSVVWYNKEGKIEPSERYHVIEDGAGGYLLEVPSAEWPDEGEWKCVATSSGGRVGISTCYVTMDVPKNYRKPRFMENLQAVLTEEGLVSFECKVVGFPTPVLSWFKDGQELKPGDVYQLTGTNSLGSYCCIARNCMGQASSSAELTVEDIQNQLNEEEKLQLFSKNQAPKFIQGLKSVEAKIDEPFRFTVKVAIPPEPSVLWYRDDQPVDESSRCHHGREERGMFYLDIQSLEFLDQAEWKCVAMNDFGHSVTSCFLKLIIPRHYKKPRFLENLQAILSDEGAVNLECKVIGVPQPVLKWYKDGEELKPGDIHRIISGQDGTCCLGTYTCEAQNCMGIAASSASLLGFDDSMKAKKKKAEEQALQRNLSLSTIHEERTSQMYDTPVGDVTTLDDKGEISFSFDGKEVSVSLYETPDLTEEEALQIVEMYADQLSENITEHNVVELPPLRFVKETSTSGNLLMEAVIIDVSPEYFVSPDEDMRTEADIEDMSIADENGPPQLSLDPDIEIGREDYLEKTMAMLSEEKSDISLRQSRKKSDSQKSADDFFSLSRDQSLSEEKRDDDTQAMSDLQSFASAHSSGKPKSKSSKPSGEDGHESSEPTKTILFKDEATKLSLEAEPSPVVKPKRERRTSRSSRRSSSGSEKSVTKSKEALLKKESIDIELPKKPTITDEEFKDKMVSISTSLSKVINDVQIIERDIILKSELMSSAATASRSLEIISSLISPLSEIHSIADAAKESISESKEVSSTLFTNLPQPLKALHQSLTIIEKCIDMESDSKTLVKKTCVAFIETCGSETQKIISDINSITSKDYLLTEEKVLTEIESLNNEMSTVIKFSADTIKTRNLLSEACEIKVEEPSLEVKHLRDTQKAVFELKSPLNSLLCIAESAEGGNIVDIDKVRNSEVILNDMSGSIQDLQTALEQIETLSVKESSLSLHKYNTEIIETVMESILKLRSSFEQLSMEPEGETKIDLKQAVASIKENLNKISSQIEVIEMNVGTFDVLQSENKLNALQKMAQILITLENNLPRLEPMPEIKNNMTVFHKNLTKVLENVIESNESKKYFTLMAICDAVSRINASIKNLDVDNLLPLASLNNTLRIIQDQFITNVFDSELNCSILTNIADTLIGIQEAINTAEEISTQIESEHIQDLTPQLYDETKAKVVVEHIDHVIAAIENVKSIESTQELKLNIAPALENICPVLEELKRNVASIKVTENKEEHLSDISEGSSFVQTLAIPLCELNQNIIIINQQLVENISSLKEKSEFVAKYAEPLYELHTTIEVLQQDIMSQYGEDLSSYDINLTMASAVQNLQSCVVVIREQAGIDAADDISTLEDISIIKTTADILPSDRLVLPATEETAVEQAISAFNQDMQTTATAQALHTLNEHITVLQSPDIIDALDTLSEVSDYSSLKSFVVGLGELHSGIEEIIHPLLMEGSNEIANLINTSKLAAIAEPMQELQQSLSVLDTSNIPIYENLLEMPTERIHSVIQSVTEFKEHLDNCMLALFPALHTADNTVEIANKVGALREVCEHLKDIIELTKTVENISMPEDVKALERTVDSLLDATDVSKGIKIEQVKTITEELYEKVAIVQDEMIQFTPQPPEKLAQEAKLIQTIDEVQNNIAVLEQYDFVDLSRTSDLMCTSPQVAAEIESDSLMLMEDIADSAVNVMQDSTQDMPIADLMIVEDFFKTCKNEFTILRCLISKATSHKKIIRLLQEFNSLQSTINDFKTKRFELTLSDDINGCLATFLIHADDCLQNVQTSLIKIVNSQAELLVEAPLAKFENSTSVLKAAKETKQDEQIIETVNKFVDILETAKPSLQNVQTNVLDEIMTAKTPVTEDNKLVDKIEEFALFVESAKTQIKDIETKDILEKVSACIEKHQDFKDASGSGKSLILLKCLSDCTDVLQESLLELKVPKQKVEEGPLKAVLTEMLEPLQALHNQLINVQEQVLRGVDEDSISVDITTTESLVQTMTEKHKEIIECIETEEAIANEEISLIMEVDKEIHSIQHSLRSIENVQIAQIVKEIAKPVEDIEKSMHCILSSEKVTVYSEDKLPKDANYNISSLENALNRFVNVESYLLDALTTTCDVNLNKCLQVAGELKELLVLDSEKPASSKLTEIKNIKIKSLKDILSNFDWQNADVCGKNQLETEKNENIMLVACQLLAELDKVELDNVEVNEDKAKQIIQHIDEYIELIEIIEEISAVIKIENIKETMDIAKELRESIAASEIIAEEEESLKNASEVREKQTRLAEKLQTALSALQVQVLDSAQELAPTLSVEVLQRIAKVTAQLQADLVAVTGIQVALQAPAETMGEVAKTIKVDKAHASAAVTELSTEVLQSKSEILEQVSVVDQLSSSEQLLATAEMLEKTIAQTKEVVASEDANILSTEILTESAQSNLEPAIAIEGTQAVVVEQVGAVSTELISKEDAKLTVIDQGQAQEVASVGTITTESVSAVEVEDLGPVLHEVTIDETSVDIGIKQTAELQEAPKAMIDILVQHIDQFVSDYITEVITEISSVINAEELKESICIAKELRENIAASEVLLRAETSDVLKSEVITQQAQLAQQLYIALAALETLSLDTLSEVPSINKETLQQVAEITENLRADLAVVTAKQNFIGQIEEVKPEKVALDTDHLKTLETKIPETSTIAKPISETSSEVITAGESIVVETKPLIEDAEVQEHNDKTEAIVPFEPTKLSPKSADLDTIGSLERTSDYKIETVETMSQEPQRLATTETLLQNINEFLSDNIVQTIHQIVSILNIEEPKQCIAVANDLRVIIAETADEADLVKSEDTKKIVLAQQLQNSLSSIQFLILDSTSNLTSVIEKDLLQQLSNVTEHLYIQLAAIISKDSVLQTSSKLGTDDLDQRIEHISSEGEDDGIAEVISEHSIEKSLSNIVTLDKTESMYQEDTIAKGITENELQTRRDSNEKEKYLVDQTKKETQENIEMETGIIADEKRTKIFSKIDDQALAEMVPTKEDALTQVKNTTEHLDSIEIDNHTIIATNEIILENKEDTTNEMSVTCVEDSLPKSEATAAIITEHKHLTGINLEPSVFDVENQSKLQVQLESILRVESDLITNAQGPVTNTETISIVTENENKELEKVASQTQVQFPTENIYSEILVVENDPTLLQQDITCSVAYEKENTIDDHVNGLTTITSAEDAIKSLHGTPNLKTTMIEQLKTDVDRSTIETVVTPSFSLELENIQLITTDSDIKHLKSTEITSDASVVDITKTSEALEIVLPISEEQIENISLGTNTEGVGIITTEPDLLELAIQANPDNQLCAEMHNVPISKTSLREQEQSEIIVTKTENKLSEQEQKLLEIDATELILNANIREITTERELPIEQEKELSEISTIDAVASDKQRIQNDTENIDLSRKENLLNDVVKEIDGADNVNIVQSTENQASNIAVVEICSQVVPENEFSTNLAKVMETQTADQDNTNMIKEIIGDRGVASDVIDLPEQDKVKNIAEGNDTAAVSAAEETDVLEQVKQVGEVSLPENIEMPAAIDFSELKIIQSEAKEDIPSVPGNVLDIPGTTDIDPTSKEIEKKINFEQGALIEHIEKFISDETKQLVDKIPILTNSQELKESMELAKVLKETIEFTNLAEEPISMEEAKMQQAKLTQMLQNALSMLQTKTIESAEDITSTPKLDAIQKVTDLFIHLQEDLQIATVSGSSGILQKMESVPIPEPDKDSMTQLKVLLQEVTDKINLTTDRSADDTEALRDCLDEVQTVIIKLKHDYDGAAADTFNETLEDLECSVRSVQLQINEDSSSELLKEACATLQLLVSNMSETQEALVIETVDKKNENTLEKCSNETDETLKLLDFVSKVEITDDNLAGIVSNLSILKETIKALKLSFVGNADVLIEKGIDVVQSLNQLEDKVFALEKDLAEVSISTGTRDHILTAIHAIYGSISNMRGTILSTQKRYMFENYGKPSEILLRSIKNISSISELDEANKNEWKAFSKSLRKVLNHFEDIKFYINLDKTARLPSDAAFTKIILEELKSNICEILVPQASILGVEAINKVDNLLNCVKANLENIEPKPTLEVKEKIPIFKVVSLHIVDVTDFIKTKINELSEDTKSSLSKQMIKVPLSMEKEVTHEIISNDAQTVDIATISQEMEKIDKIDDISKVLEETVSVAPSTAESLSENDIKTKVKPRKQVLIQDVDIRNDIEKIAYEFVDEIASNAIVAVQNFTELVSYEENAENMAQLIETDVLEEVQACQIDVNVEENIPTTEEISVLQSENEENAENMAQSGETDILQQAQIDVNVEGSVPAIEEIPMLIKTNEDNAVQKSSADADEKLNENVANQNNQTDDETVDKRIEPEVTVSQIVQKSKENERELLENEQMLPESYQIQSIEETPKQDGREIEEDKKDNIDKMYMEETETGQQRTDMFSGPLKTNELQEISETTEQKHQENLQQEEEETATGDLKNKDNLSEEKVITEKVKLEAHTEEVHSFDKIFIDTRKELSEAEERNEQGGEDIEKTKTEDDSEGKLETEIKLQQEAEQLPSQTSEKGDTEKKRAEEENLQKHKKKVENLEEEAILLKKTEDELNLKKMEEVENTILPKADKQHTELETLSKREDEEECLEQVAVKESCAEEENIRIEKKEEAHLIIEAEKMKKVEIETEKNHAKEEILKGEAQLGKKINTDEENLKKVKQETLENKEVEVKEENKDEMKQGAELKAKEEETEENMRKHKEEEALSKKELEEREKAKIKCAEEEKINIEKDIEERVVKELDDKKKADILQKETENKLSEEESKREEAPLPKEKEEAEKKRAEEEKHRLEKEQEEARLVKEAEKEISEENIKKLEEEERLKKEAEDKEAVERKKQQKAEKQRVKEEKARLAKEKEAEEENLRKQKEEEERLKIEAEEKEKTEKKRAEKLRLEKEQEEARLTNQAEEENKAKILQQETENKLAEEERRKEEARLAKEKEIAEEDTKNLEEEELLKKEAEDKIAAERKKQQKAEKQRVKEEKARLAKEKEAEEENLRKQKEEEARLKIEAEQKEKAEKKRAEEEKLRLEKEQEEARLIKQAEEENKAKILQQETENKLAEEEKRKEEARLAKEKEIAEENIKKLEEEERLKKKAEDKNAAERKKQQKAEKQRVQEEKARLAKEKEAEEEKLRKQKEEEERLKIEAEEKEKAEKKRAEEEKLRLEKEQEEARLIKQAEEENKAKILQQETENKIAEEERRKEEARLAKEKEIAEENIKKLEEEERLKKEAEDKEAVERKKQQKAEKQRVKEEKARLAKEKEAEEENLRKQKEKEARLKVEAEEKEKSEKKRAEEEKLRLEKELEEALKTEAEETEQAETEKQKKEKKHTEAKIAEKEEITNVHKENEEVLATQESKVIKRVSEETIKQDEADNNEKEKSKKCMEEDEKAKSKISKQKQKGQQDKPCDQIKTDNGENQEEFGKKTEIVIQGKAIDKEVTVDAKIQQQEKSIKSTEEKRSIKESTEKNNTEHEDALKLEQVLDKSQTEGMKNQEFKTRKETEKREKSKKVSEEERKQDKIKQEEEYIAKGKDENQQKDVEKREKQAQEAKRKEELLKQEEAEKLEQENKRRARLEKEKQEEELRQAEEKARQEKKKISKRAKEEQDARLSKEAEEAEQARKDSIRKKKDKEKARLLKEQAEAEEREQEIRESERRKREERRRQIEEGLIEKKLSVQESKSKTEENGVLSVDSSKEDHYIREYQYEPTKQKSDERSKFVDHNHRDYTMEFLRPSGYREKSFDHERFSERESLGKCATIYKAQTLILDAQLRTSTPPQPERDESEKKIDRFDRSDSERRIERHRSKALSESRSLISEKRSSLSRDLKRKPVFSTYLTDRTAVESSRVKLTCSVLSSSDPKIIWYRNGVLLDDKLKYRTKFLDGLITLEVLNAVVSDSAEYTCTVENDNGSVSTSANLKVYPSFEASPIPPTFTRSIRDTYHLAENELVLECRIRGQPLPTITWLKDDKPVSINERYQAYYLADGVCRLAISAPTPEDSGKYTCKAENSVWSDQITHVVSFTGKECRLSPNIATIERSRFNRQALESRRPHFTNVLSDYKVAKGGTIGLQVEIRGHPTRVEWLREGRSVTEVYRNARTFVEQGLYTLALSDVTEKESGLYTCRAWSTHGNVDMNAAITVVPPTELEGKPAIIVGRPEKDILISVGEDVNISFRVQGEPKPKVIFMKGIRDITTSQRVCKMTSDDYVQFTLKRSIISDAGTYCILARNAYGCDRAFVTVVIRQRASSENLISDWTYPMDDSALSIAERKYKSVPDRIPGEPSVVDGGNNWVSLAWPKADPRDTAPVLAYKIESWLLGKEGGARWIELGITPLNSFDAFNLKQGEEYHFRVTPKNRYGWGESVQTSTPVGIGLAGDRPEFVEILPGQLKVLAGETANLSCSVKGKPLAEVVWMKNGHELEEDSRMTTLFNGQDCSLTIKDICIEDEARYSCEASNANGRASTYARLAVVTDRLVWEADAKLKRERSQDAEGDYPPQFTMRLRDRRVQATYPVRLTCQVVGSPPPTLTWYKEGELLVFDSRRNNYQDEHFHTLEIAPTTLEDGGIYEAMARNSSGAVSCRCSLVVDKGIRAYVAPEFCCGLEPLYRLTEGEELRISAVVEAYPSVGVTWYRDGVRLRPSRRAIMTLDRDGQIELALASVTARDAGVYTCTASNEVGRATTSGKVDIIEGHEPRDKKTPPVLINAPDVPYSKEPMFICKPRSSEAREGDTVIIACEVIGDPKPDVYWLRDFLKPDYYRDATHFKRVGDGPEYRFEIPHAKLDYTGAYSVVARNVHGEAKAIISLQILAKDPSSADDSHNVRYGRVEVIPRFERELTDLLSYDGDAIEFECIVTGNPEPDIRWFHYNELIRDCADFESSFDEGAARLKIKQVTAEDEGTYSCEASNNLGKATSSACLVVYPPGEPNTLSQRLRRPPALLSAASTPRSTPRSTPARSVSRTPGPDVRRLCSPSRQMAPSFYTYPFNKVVEEGENVTFKCAVKGQPAPWATWDKDGIIITPSARITIKEKEELLRILEIEQVSIEDVGIYRITVENEFGRAEASARLEVISQKGKFYGGVRAYSPSPRKSLTFRRYPSVPRQD